jgi:hypothetical protein
MLKVLVVALALAGGQTVKPAPPPSLVAQADALYAKRADLGRVREAIRLVAEARTSDPKDFDATWRLAKFSYYLAAHTTDEREQERTFKAGIDAGVAAIALQAARPEGYFWRGANLGGRAKARGGLGAYNSVDDIRTAMDAVVRIEPGFQNGTAYMILGQIDLQVPGWLGGSKRRAVEELETGLKHGEGDALWRVQRAEAYVATHREADARRQLDAVLTMKPNPDYLPEYQEAAAEARHVLGELDGTSSNDAPKTNNSPARAHGTPPAKP